MKKIIIAMMSFFMIVSFSTMALATDSTQTGDEGTVVTISESSSDGGSGPGITFTPSPNTFMFAKTDADNFTIIAYSSKTNTSTGIEYGIKSTEAAVFQMVQIATPVAPTSSTVLGGDFKDKAGNSTS